ncbi:hypothetical protein HYALB_00001507 [Hymenoscyphus albidus]|uniref:Uncharacterized protein n=1 Tax=Hymenoscyphus albidus TaxID=595503 RepID=A0A9N9PWK1_9HELO|nr:hypothetical protein HYALB_00001507 [Hymenoscyphus albidus]
MSIWMATVKVHVEPEAFKSGDGDRSANSFSRNAAQPPHMQAVGWTRLQQQQAGAPESAGAGAGAGAETETEAEEAEAEAEAEAVDCARQ